MAGLGALALLCGGLVAAIAHEETRARFASLGRGVASVDTMPVGELAGAVIERGDASYYGDEFAGNRTANGESFDPARLTAAHRTLPLGSRVRVTNPQSGESVVVRINDRGPFHGDRVIDLSYAAAREIGLIRSGTGRVSLALEV